MNRPAGRCGGLLRALPTRAARQIHETIIRRVGDCDLWDHRLTVERLVRRVICPDCGIGHGHINWLPKQRGMSERLAQQKVKAHGPNVEVDYASFKSWPNTTAK